MWDPRCVKTYPCTHSPPLLPHPTLATSRSFHILFHTKPGLTYREIHYVCEELALTRRLVSMDLVEVNPSLVRQLEPTTGT